MSESSWPPRVRESHEPGASEDPHASAPEPAASVPERASSASTVPEPASTVPEPAEPGTPESIGAVDHEETEVRSDARGPEGHEGAEPEEDPASDRSRLIRGLLIGGLVLMTALAATFLALWLGSSETEADDVRAYMDEQRPEIELRARTAVDILINYDAADIDERRAEMLEISTGGFRDDYEQFTDSLGDALQDAGASSRGSILDEPRITFTSPEEADAVIRTEQIAQTSDNPAGRTIEYIMRLGLIDTQGGWKVDNIEILSDEVT